MSYDSVDILKYFSDRQKIDVPLLADPDSKTIRAYRVLNTEAAGQFKGMARPGYFFIDHSGAIRRPRRRSRRQHNADRGSAAAAGCARLRARH